MREEGSSPSSSSCFTVLTSSKSGDLLSRKAGLLRLFNSDFFDSSMAVSYLWKYNRRETGIQFAVCERLKRMPISDLEFLLPQLWYNPYHSNPNHHHHHSHLSICNSDESPSLEHFLLELCQRSLHAAAFSLWYFENYLVDFRKTFIRNAKLYLRTVRLLKELQRILFRNHISGPGQLSKSWSFEDENFDTLLSKAKLELVSNSLPGISASIVGVGCALAGATVPDFALISRSMVMTEARQVGYDRRKTKKPIRATSEGYTKNVSYGTGTPSMEELYRGSAFSFKEYFIKAAKQMNVNPPTFMTISGSSTTMTGAGMSGNGANRASNSNSSTPELSRQLSSNPSIPPAVPLYYYAEMQFVMSLIDISLRLVTVPKEGRLKALMAELALINHNLPAPICVPLWCTESNHHKILRICPSDAVVLNSAERVPFLLQIEVLESDCSDGEFQGIVKNCLEVIRTIQKSPSQTQLDDPLGEEEEGGPSESFSPLKDHESLSSSPIEARPNANRRGKVDLSILTLDEQRSASSMYPLREIDPSVVELTPLSADDFSERMRTAAIMLAQLARQAAQPECTSQKLTDISAIKTRIIKEMETLEKNRLLDALQNNETNLTQDHSIFLLDDDGKQTSSLFDREDPSAIVFQEAWNDKVQRIKGTSPFGNLNGWKLLSVIVKSGSDMRQEQLACQIISEMTSIWRKAGLPLWTYCYRVLVASSNGGLIETVPNAISLHSIKKNAYWKNNNPISLSFSLRDHYIKVFGSPDSERFSKARDCFTESLAAYSLATYLLQVKDRHDGNILMDNEGHLIHIDFGFMLSNSPGYVGFESAPFKLSQEYIELLGGLHSVEFAKFKDLMFKGFLELRKHADRIMVLLDIMQKESTLPCFYSGEAALAHLRQRFHLTLTDTQLRQVVDRLVISSAYNVFTKLYDTFQYYSNGIL